LIGASAHCFACAIGGERPLGGVSAEVENQFLFGLALTGEAAYRLQKRRVAG